MERQSTRCGAPFARLEGGGEQEGSVSRPLSMLRTLHNLETMAVQIYQVQIPRLSDPSERELMAAARDNERLHHDTFEGFLRRRRARPSWRRPFWWLVGQVLGRSAALPGRSALLGGDILFEEKAVREYAAFIAEKVLEGEEASALERFLEDEKRHVATWRRLKGARQKPGVGG